MTGAWTAEPQAWRITGAAKVTGVVGAPVGHSLSPVIHNAWITAAGLDAVYAPFAPTPSRFAELAAGFRGGSIRGLNVTIPFKEAALAVADVASARARRARAANLLLFEQDGRIVADNTDGEGLMAALAGQAAGWRPEAGPAVIVGAGGAARAAAAALADAGAPEVRIVGRTPARAQALAAELGGPVRAAAAETAFRGATLVVNATPAGLGGGKGPDAELAAARAEAAVVDMVYRPLRTEFLARAIAVGLRPVDGLAMLIGQARPSFRAFFGLDPPDIDVRSICLAALTEKKS